MTPAEREERILSLEPQVKYLAGRKHALLPFTRVHLDEMISAAWLGAIRAVDSFDESMPNTLKTYARWKIASAMADYLRSLDPLTRPHRDQVNVCERDAVRRQAAGLDPDPARIAAPLILSAEARFKHGEERPSPLARVADERAATRQRALDARLTLEKIYARAARHRAINTPASLRESQARLDRRNVRILERSMEGEFMRDIGASLGIHESRVSQICKHSLELLRAAA
jgi:RNA polymerase sigma factor (sigma-70 family)